MRAARVRARIVGAAACVLIAWLVGVPGVTGLAPARAEGDGDRYVAEIERERHAHDEELRSTQWSPLALREIVRLQSERTSIGSAPEADLRLSGKGIAAHHAEVLRRVSTGAGPTFVLRSLDGDARLEAEPQRRLDEKTLASGERFRIGRFSIYYQEVATLGPMLRVLDFESPAFTRFDGLRYFPPDPSYRVPAVLEPYPEPRPTQIIDTMGWLSRGWLYGEVVFSLEGERLRMKLVLLSDDPSSDDLLYLIFNDATNGRETDPVCRYLLISFVEKGELELDFNRAVNPHCAYNTGFACPLPPPGNRATIEVRAGEKRYPHGPRP